MSFNNHKAEIYEYRSNARYVKSNSLGKMIANINKDECTGENVDSGLDEIETRSEYNQQTSFQEVYGLFKISKFFYEKRSKSCDATKYKESLKRILPKLLESANDIKLPIRNNYKSCQLIIPAIEVKHINSRFSENQNALLNQNQRYYDKRQIDSFCAGSVCNNPSLNATTQIRQIPEVEASLANIIQTQEKNVMKEYVSEKNCDLVIVSNINHLSSGESAEKEKKQSCCFKFCQIF